MQLKIPQEIASLVLVSSQTLFVVIEVWVCALTDSVRAVLNIVQQHNNP